MPFVTLFKDPFSGERETVFVKELIPFFRQLWAEFPKNARLYYEYVSVDHDVTPLNKEDVDRLDHLKGNFHVVLHPQDPWVTPIVVAVVIAAAAVAATFLLKPKSPSIAPNSTSRNTQSTSPNNELSERTNKARPGGRIPDIFGTVRSTPDLIVSPYAEFVNNREVEHTVLCLSRGYCEIHDTREDTTDCRYVPDMSVQFYHPYTDIVSGEPYYSVGPPIADAPKLSKRSNSINGQKLDAPNAKNYAGSSNINFSAPDVIRATGVAENTLADRFRSGDDIVLTNTASNGNSLNLDGTYRTISVSDNTIWLDEPARVNPNWNSVSSITGTSTKLSSTGEHWIGWFLLADKGREEVWINVVALNGLFWTDDQNNQNAITVNNLFQIQPTDRRGEPIGEIEEFTLSMRGSSVDRATVSSTLKAKTSFTGPCRVRGRRISNTITGAAQTVDEVQWRDLYEMAELPVTEYGNVTMIRLSSVATPGALALKERKLNCLTTRQIPLWIEGDSFTEEYFSTDNAADIFCATMLDPYIGRRSKAELDFENIHSSIEEVEEYFGTSLCAHFCYTFDNENTSAEETAAMVAGAGFCTAYRMGVVIRLFFERQQDMSTLLFCHRNKLPGTETRTITFGLANDNDGVELEYVSPDDDSIDTVIFPEDETAVNPRKIETIGVRNRLQAYMQAKRAWNRAQYQRLSTTFEATQEADLVLPGMRILVTDNIRDQFLEGTVKDQDGLEIFAWHTLNMEADYTDSWGVVKRKPYYCFLQLADGRVQQTLAYAGNHHNSFILREPPLLPLVFEDAAYAKTTFAIVENYQDTKGLAFLVEEKGVQQNFTLELTCVNYDDRYYRNDQDYRSGVVDEEGIEI